MTPKLSGSIGCASRGSAGVQRIWQPWSFKNHCSGVRGKPRRCTTQAATGDRLVFFFAAYTARQKASSIERAMHRAVFKAIYRPMQRSIERVLFLIVGQCSIRKRAGGVPQESYILAASFHFGLDGD